MTPCRPTTEQPRCAYCERKTLATTHTTKGGRHVDNVILDVTSVLRPGKPCPLYVPMQSKEAA